MTFSGLVGDAIRHPGCADGVTPLPSQATPNFRFQDKAREIAA